MRLTSKLCVMHVSIFHIVQLTVRSQNHSSIYMAVCCVECTTTDTPYTRSNTPDNWLTILFRSFAFCLPFPFPGTHQPISGSDRHNWRQCSANLSRMFPKINELSIPSNFLAIDSAVMIMQIVPVTICFVWFSNALDQKLTLFICMLPTLTCTHSH